LSKDTLEEDVNELILDTKSLLSLVNSKRTGHSIGGAGDSWPEINLTVNEIQTLTSTLEQMGQRVSKIRQHSSEIGDPFNTISQNLLNSHARSLYKATGMEQGRLKQWEYGTIWKDLDSLKNHLQDFESQHRIKKSYEPAISDHKHPKLPQSTTKLRISWIKAVGLIIAIISAIGGGTYYFMSVQNTVNVDIENSPESVVSVNQTGGITAHTVNVEPTARHVDEKFIDQLNQYLPKDKEKTIKIEAVLGDQETFQFATEIKDYLESRGWKIEGVDLSVFRKPIFGINITPETDGSITITVGSKG